MTWGGKQVQHDVKPTVILEQDKNCHPEFISGSLVGLANGIRQMLKQVQHDKIQQVQHDVGKINLA